MYHWESESVVLFDGVCNLCNGIVNFLIDADHQKRLKFASLQSETGQLILMRFGMDTADFDTFVFYSKGRTYTRSRAALEVARELGGMWQLAYAAIIIPPLLRDGIYRWIAANRYRWFGKRDTCRMPTPELKTRFL
jgi:predicted DCC family thiol-disulfide oxidoreductase YuxK